MAVIGVGICPAGTSMCGYGQIPSTTTTRRTLPNPTNIKQVGTGRYYDSFTKTFAYDTDGNPQGQGTAQQLVALAINHIKFDLPFYTLMEKPEEYIYQQILDALAELVKDNVIEIQSASYQKTNSRVSVYLRIKDLIQDSEFDINV